MSADQKSMEHWRGKVDTQLEVIDFSNKAQSAKIDLIDTRMRSLELKVEMLATKLVIYSALGATIGSALVSVVIGIVFRALAKG